MAFDIPYKNVKRMKFHLIFRASIHTTDETYKRIQQGAWSWIEDIRVFNIRVNNQDPHYGKQIENYGQGYSMLCQQIMPFSMQHKPIIRIGNKDTRNKKGALLNGTVYIIPLHEYINEMINNAVVVTDNTIRVEFTIRTPESFIKTDGNNLEFMLDDCKMDFIEIETQPY